MPSMLAMLVLALALDGGPVRLDTYPHAHARRGCTQEDAPALEIYLTPQRTEGPGQPAPPYVHIEVAWTDWDAAASTRLELVPLSRHGVDPRKPIVRAELVREAGESIWLRGTLQLRSVDVGRRVDGTYRFIGPGDEPLNGTFTATWIDSPGGCG